MGSYLSKLGLSPRSPAQARTDLDGPGHRRPARPLSQVHRIQHVHRAQPARRHRPARRPPNWDPTNPSAFVNEAWRRFPMKRPQNCIMGPLPSDWWDSYLKRNIWSLRHPRAVWSPVTVKISPPEQTVPPSFTAAVVINSAGPSEEKPPPVSSATETVLRALWQCRKERVRLEGSLFPQSLDIKRGTPEARRSAFKPLIKNTAIISFVPRPGPLKRGHYSQSSDHSLKRSSCFSVTGTGTPLSTKRNAISSSYSSHRDSSEPGGRRPPRAPSVQEPEWPLKKRGKSCSHSPASTASESEPPETSGSSGQVSQEVLQLPSSPGDQQSKVAGLQCGHAVTGEHQTLREQAGLPWRSNNRKDTVVTAKDSVAEARPGTQLSPSLTSPSSGTAPSVGTDPQQESSEDVLESPGPWTTPPSTGEDFRVVHSPLKMPTLMALLEGSQTVPVPGTSSLSKPTTASIRLAPNSPTNSSDTDPTGPSASLEADRSATTPHSTPTLHDLASATSAHPVLKPTQGPPQSSEVRGDLHPRISVADSVSSRSSLSTAPGILLPTFTPIFGSMAPLTSVPVVASIPARLSPLPLTPVSLHLFQGLAKSTSLIMPTAPTNTSEDSAYKSSLDFSIVKVTNTMSSISSASSSCHSFLLESDTGFVSPPRQYPSIPTVHTVTIFSQVLMSSTETSPLKTTANLKGVGSLLSASDLAPPNQPAEAPSNSSMTSAFTTPLGSSPKPPFSPPPGDTSQPTCGARDGEKQCLFQPALAPRSNSSFPLKNSITSSTPRPMVPAQPVLGRTAQSALGGVTSLVSTCHIPAGIQPSLSSTPAGFSFGEACPTGLEVAKQSHQSGACGSVFGITAPRPFAFGGLVTPMDCEEPETIVTVPQLDTSEAVLNGTTRTLTPFTRGWSENTSSQNPLSALGGASLTTRKPLTGGPSALSIPISGSRKAGGKAAFGVSFPSSQDSTGKDPLRLWAPLFSIGTKSKTLRTQHGYSRRHYSCKK